MSLYTIRWTCIAIINTALWSMLITSTINSVVYTILLFPWLLVVMLWPLVPVVAVLYFWAWCYAIVSRMDKKRKPWLEVLLVIPLLMVLLPMLIHVGALAGMLGSWIRALRPQNPEPAETDDPGTALVVHKGFLPTR